MSGEFIINACKRAPNNTSNNSYGSDSQMINMRMRMRITSMNHLELILVGSSQLASLQNRQVRRVGVGEWSDSIGIAILLLQQTPTTWYLAALSEDPCNFRT